MATAAITKDMVDRAVSVFTQYPVSMAAVFGSYARAEATEQSDIDILVEFSAPVGVLFFGLKADLELALQRPVDLFRFSDMRRSAFSAQVMKEAKTIYVAHA